MRAPDILFISIDCLRADAVSAADTPFMDSLRSNGLQFDRHFATGAWTAPSFVGMMTGEQPRSYSQDMAIHSYPETVAETMREEGYRTIASLDANYWISSAQGFDQGFDEFTNYVDADRFRSDMRRERARDDNPLATRLPSAITERFPHAIDTTWNLVRKDERVVSTLRKLDMLGGSPKMGVGAQAVIDEFMDDFTAGSSRDPTFGWIHFMDLHHPYLPDNISLREKFAYPAPIVSYVNNAAVHPDESLGKRGVQFLKSLYARKVEEIDKSIERLVETFTSNSDRDTVVIIIGDHGEEFKEHGRLTHANKPYNELIHVPLIIHGMETGAVSQNTSSIDLKSAILEIARCGCDVKSSFGTQPVCRYIHDSDRIAERTDKALNGQPSPAEIRTVVQENMKVHYDSDADKVKIFDLDNDFTEQVDLSGSREHCDLVAAAVREYIREKQELADQELLSDVDR